MSLCKCQDIKARLLLEAMRWQKPPTSTIKLNVDAALNKNSAWLRAVARDEKGIILKVWEKDFPTCSPMVAEAAALLWAIQIAKEKNYHSIIVEGDALACVNAINGGEENQDWSITSICSDIDDAGNMFHSFCFCWINREINMVDHETAKFAALNCFSFSYFKSSLPPSIWEAWNRDLLLAVV